ncbi:glycosyltransferase [Campylobacter devanensis]|uniref:glycosyltransferase n=1 Tax=Campylobacter devanensis TaxID=3161138 RepID=UPI000A354FCB|nr:glycosyltransferase [Campylobacter sp. P031]
MDIDNRDVVNQGEATKIDLLQKEILRLEKELEDYKGARLKYKRLANNWEYKYNKLNNSIPIKISRLFKSPFNNNLFKSILKNIKKRNNNEPNVKLDYDNVAFEKLQNFGRKDKPVILIYGNISLNIVDGSSIWLSNIYNLAISACDVILLSKQNIQSNLITSNFIKNNNQSIVLEPKDFGEKEFSIETAIKALVAIDSFIPNIQLLVTRGLELNVAICSNNVFKYRLVPYLTDFYTITNKGLEYKDDIENKLDLIAKQAKIWLFQTPNIQNEIEKILKYKIKCVNFAPVIPKIKNYQTVKNDVITIAYGGKIQPDWGILELIKECKELISLGYKLKLIIVSSKISAQSDIINDKNFIQNIKELLSEPFVEYIDKANQEKTLEILSKADILYGFRPKYFEEHTLELSTKILEAVALYKPIICYPNDINIELFGKDYRYFIHDICELVKILQMDNFDIDKNIYDSIIKKYSFENRKDFFKQFLIDNKDKRLLCMAGHDFKFIDHFYSYMKASGYRINKDVWEWGECKNEMRSKYHLQVSDTIFCEWGLANAVWYSHHNSNKKIYVRVHLQEIREKARKFGFRINSSNITNFIFVSARVRDEYIKMFNLEKSKTSVIPNYELNDDFVINNNKKLGINLGMVGITPQRKRLDRAVDLIQNLLTIYPDAKLYIKGHRPEQYEWMHAPGRIKELEYYNQQYQRINDNEALKNAVIFDEFGNDMSRWYQKIDFILSPSDFESFHYALADGVASGCLPVVWNWDEASVLYDGSWIVNDDTEAVEKIKSYLNADNIDEIRNNNRKLIIQRYGYQKVFNQIKKAIYES